MKSMKCGINQHLTFIRETDMSGERNINGINQLPKAAITNDTTTMKK